MKNEPEAMELLVRNRGRRCDKTQIHKLYEHRRCSTWVRGCVKVENGGTLSEANPQTVRAPKVLPYDSRGPLRPADNERVGKECRRYSPLFRGFLPTVEGYNPLYIRGYLRHPHPITCIPGGETPGYQVGAPLALFSLCATWLLYDSHYDTPPISEVAQLVLNLTGSASPVTHAPLPEDDPCRRKPDISLASRELGGWRPRVSLQEGLLRTIAYFRGIMQSDRP